MTTPKKILIIDDDPMVLKSISRLLVKKGYEVETAASGAAAIKSVKKTDFDLVMSDIRMPEIDGIETVDIIQAHYQAHGHDCAFMFITGFAEDDRLTAARQKHQAKVVFKPFELTDLLETLQMQLLLERGLSEE